MKKKELSSLKHLNATRKILKMAAEDTPKTIGIGRYSTYEKYQTGLYLRCMVQGNILYVAISRPHIYGWGPESRRMSYILTKVRINF